jgi:molybdenum cofactor guanylyltransferase
VTAERGDAGCTGVVLCGGRAERLGGVAKGTLALAGRPIVDVVLHALEAAADEVVFAIRAGQSVSAHPAVRRVIDTPDLAGPAAGIHAALADVGGPVLVCAWDMPFVSAEIFRMLRRTGEEGRWDAVLPCDADEVPQPLCAWYGPRAQQALAEGGDRSIMELLAGARVRLVASGAVSRCGDPSRLFVNVNTPRDLERARSLESTG